MSACHTIPRSREGSGSTAREPVPRSTTPAPSRSSSQRASSDRSQGCGVVGDTTAAADTPGCSASAATAEDRNSGLQRCVGVQNVQPSGCASRRISATTAPTVSVGLRGTKSMNGDASTSSSSWAVRVSSSVSMTATRSPDSDCCAQDAAKSWMTDAARRCCSSTKTTHVSVACARRGAEVWWPRTGP